jgi:streptomycin 6-kinase
VIVVPAEFASERVRKSGAAGRRWIADLPTLVERVCQRWAVELTGDAPSYGVWGMVVLGHRGAEPCAIKVSWPEHPTMVEAAALRAWNGNGAVRLLQMSPENNALLLERLDSGRTLEDLDLLAAAEIAGGIIRRLAVPPPADSPLAVDTVPVQPADDLAVGLRIRQAELGHPVPRRFVELAADLARDLASTSARVLVHTDLHYGNILAGRRQPWLAIDPRPVVGDPELSVPELMWWRLDDAVRDEDVRTLLDVLVATGDLDHERATAWTVVRAVDYWLWGLANGLTEDPVRCHRLLEILA